MEAVAPEEYAAFIAQIQMRSIWMVRAKVDNHVGPDIPEHARIRIVDRPTWEVVDGGFRATSHYQIQVASDTDAIFATLEFSLAVDFSSDLPMTDAISLPFGEYNLPLNTWPYLREFIASSFGRMNWLSFTIPALKRGIGASKSQSGSKRRPRTAPDPNPCEGDSER